MKYLLAIGVSKCFLISSYTSSSLIQSLTGTGKPSFLLLYASFGITFLAASLNATLVAWGVTLYSKGNVDAIENTHLSVNGTLDSSELAIVILSPLCRMSLTNQ